MNASGIEILAVTNRTGILQKPPPMVTPDHQRDRSKFCLHHNSYGHKTKDCKELKKEIEHAIRKGELNKFILKKRNNRGRN